MISTTSFNGNVVDESGNAIDVWFRGYHVEQNKWSGWYTTQDQFYSLDLIDEDSNSDDEDNHPRGAWLTKDGNTNPDDHIILIFETKEADPKDRKFAIYEFQMNGSDTYNQDIQVRPCMNPLVQGRWYLESPTDGSTTFVNSDDNDRETYIGRINEAIGAVSDFTDEKSWEYTDSDDNTITLWHKAEVGGSDVFGDRVGIDSVEYDWTEDDNFVTDTSHTFTEISSGDDKSQEVEVRVTNKKGLVVNDVLKIQIRYNSPVADLTFSPTEPSINDTFTVKGTVVM